MIGVPGGQGSLKVIASPYLSDSNTSSSYSTTTYYLVGDPALVESVTVFTLQGIQTPMVIEYDTGAVMSRGWKVAYPFATVAAPIYGREQCTA
jgi:hypothetical protein